MSASRASDTDQLVQQAAAGDLSARRELLDRHLPRLKRMLAVRMDRRLASRVDPSDVVQETLIEAAHRLPDYLERQPLPFYPWLRQLAGERLADLHRRHVVAKRRAVDREEPLPLPDHSAWELVRRLTAPQSSPSQQAQREELQTLAEVIRELGGGPHPAGRMAHPSRAPRRRSSRGPPTVCSPPDP